jgi:hypothetical protein
MDNIKPALTVSQFIKDNELVNLANTHDLYNATGCVMNFNDYAIRLLHHNVQSLNNKLLDIAIMLTTGNLNVNILCFTEHWLSEVQMNILNINYFRLVSSFSRNQGTSGGSCIFTRNTTETKKLIILVNWEMKKFLKYLQLNCLILVPSWPVFIDNQIVIFMNFYVNWSY